jgi:hypothetical protein
MIHFNRMRMSFNGLDIPSDYIFCIYIDSIFLPYVTVNFGDNLDRDNLITSISHGYYVNKIIIIIIIIII